MKIVYEAPLFVATGGGPRHFEGIVAGLRSAGIEPVVVLPSQSAVDVGRAPDVSLSARGGRALRHLTYEFSRLCLLVRWVLQRRRVDVWMARHSLFGLSLPLARLVARVVVLEVNGPVREEVRNNFGSAGLASIVDWCFRWQIRSADLVVAVTPGLAGYAKQRFAGAQVLVLPNGALPPSEEVRRLEVGIQRAELVFAGAVTPWYDLETVLQAVRRLPRRDGVIALRVVGDGSGLDGLRKRVVELELTPHVEFTGWVSADLAKAYVLASEVGLLPMMPKDRGLPVFGSPLKLFEYAACGLPVVGHALDGIENSPLVDSTFVYPPGDVNACVEAILHARAIGTSDRGAALWRWDSRVETLLNGISESGL